MVVVPTAAIGLPSAVETEYFVVYCMGAFNLSVTLVDNKHLLVPVSHKPVKNEQFPLDELMESSIIPAELLTLLEFISSSLAFACHC